MKRISWYLTILATFILVGSGWAYGSKSSATDRQQIEALLQNMAKAYNEGNEENMQRLWALDGELVSVPGDVIAKGHGAIIKEFKENQDEDYKNAKIEMSITNLRFIGKKAAWVETKSTLTGLTTARGTQMPPIFHHSIILVEKEKKQWVIDAVRWYSAVPIVRHRQGG